MSKPSRSIGLDDAGGRPAGAPDGPYITDRTDDSSRRGAQRDRAADQQPAGSQPQRAADLASRRKGPAQP